MCTYTHSVMMKEFFQYELENFVQPQIDKLYKDDLYPFNTRQSDKWEQIRDYLENRITELEIECKEKERMMRKGETDAS